MASIKIIDTPPGKEPVEVRQQWVGMVMPYPPQETEGVQVGVQGGVSKIEDGYQVLSRDAFDLLLAKSPSAYRWFMDNGIFGSRLVFPREVCELLPGVEIIVDHDPLGIEDPDE